MGNTTEPTRRVSTDTGPFALIPEWVIYHEGVSAVAVRLYATLARHADDTGSAYPSKKRLATLCGCSVSTIDRCITELVAARALHVEPRTRDDGSRASNMYLVRRTHLTHDMGVHLTEDVAPHFTHEVGMNETHDEREPEERSTLPAAPVSWDPLAGIKVAVEGEKRPQDLVWNALAQVIDTDEPPHGSRMRAAVATIRRVMWEHLVSTFGEDRVRARGESDPEGYERALAESVVAVNRWLRDQSPGLTYGPEGYARNFRRGVAGLSAAASTSSIVEEALRASAR